jgi:pimeloyl-ACP methyl ester carboxylesterase
MDAETEPSFASGSNRPSQCKIARPMIIDADLVTPGSLQMPPDRANNFWYVRRDPKNVIVFLHGIFSASRTCWLYEDSASRQRVFWPDLVRHDKRFGKASIYLAGYYTAVDAGDFSIAQCAREVVEALKQTDADGLPPVLDARTVSFVCHSTGGIVARYMIDRYIDAFRDKALGLALIASPSLGSVWANTARLAAKFYNQRLGQQLQWDGEALEDIHGRFKDLVNETGARLPGLFGMEACENKMIMRDRIPALVRWLVPPRLKVVTTLSAGQYFGEVKVLRGTDHFSSVKPDGPNHPSHEFLVTFQREFQRATERSSTESAASAAPNEGNRTSEPQREDDLEATEWPDSSSSTSLFLSATGFDAESDIAVVTCVVLDDVGALNDSLNQTLQSWLRDPYLRDLPGLSDVVRQRDLTYTNLDPDLRAKLVDWLSAQLFEAYVCYGRRTPLGNNDEAMLDSLLRDRLAANRTKTITVKPDVTLAVQRAHVMGLVSSVKNHVRTTSKDLDDLAVSVEDASGKDAGSTAAMLVGHLVRARLRARSGLEGRAFARIHPQKIRVMHDFDAQVRYTRRHPFQG